MHQCAHRARKRKTLRAFAFLPPVPVVSGQIGVKPDGYVLPYGGLVKTMKPVERYECSDGKDRWMAPMSTG